jgi:hypothetical protein
MTTNKPEKQESQMLHGKHLALMLKNRRTYLDKELLQLVKLALMVVEAETYSGEREQAINALEGFLR